MIKWFELDQLDRSCCENDRNETRVLRGQEWKTSIEVEAWKMCTKCCNYQSLRIKTQVQLTHQSGHPWIVVMKMKTVCKSSIAKKLRSRVLGFTASVWAYLSCGSRNGGEWRTTMPSDEATSLELRNEIRLCWSLIVRVSQNPQKFKCGLVLSFTLYEPADDCRSTTGVKIRSQG